MHPILLFSDIGDQVFEIPKPSSTVHELVKLQSTKSIVKSEQGTIETLIFITNGQI